MNLREIERESIRSFVQSAAADGYLSGRVLDYGCGQQPYRDIVEAAGGEYHGYDNVHWPANVSGKDVGEHPTIVMVREGRFSAVLMTQVIQYIPMEDLMGGMTQGGYHHFWTPIKDWSDVLVMTYPTNWPEVEPEDLHRFTKAGMERLLSESGFEIIRHEPRAWFDPWGGTVTTSHIPPDALALGYGVIACA